MAPLPMYFSLVMSLGLIATLSGSMAKAEDSKALLDEDTNSTNMVGINSECSPLQRRQDLLDNRMNLRDARLNERDADLNRRLTGIDTRLNRLDDRFAVLATEISDMKEYLQQRTTAIEAKAELALACTNCKNGGSRPTTTTQSDNQPTQMPKDCQEAYTMGQTSSGVYRISPEPNIQIDVYCEQELDQGGWVVFQLRKDGTTDFYRNWTTYKNGFRGLTGEFWLGNTNIHLLTKHHDQKLKIELTAPDGEVKYADYGQFWTEDESQKYRLYVTDFSGVSPPEKGPWWYKTCNKANLNGLYGGTDSGSGVTWGTWKGYEISLTGSRMMMKKRD